MADGPDVDVPSHPNFLVATAVYEAFPEGDIVLRPAHVDGLTETFTVIHVGEVVDAVQYFAGLYGEHNLEDMPVNPMNLETLVIGVQLIDGRLTIADALSVEDGTSTIAVANMLMVAQYGGMLTTDQQPDDPDSPEWTVHLEEYPDPVTCDRVATIEHDGDTYYCYVGEGLNDGVTEYFLLIVQVIDNEFFSVDTDDNELWSALLGAFLDQFGVEADDGSDDDPEGDGKEPDEDESEAGDRDSDTSVC